MTGKPMRPAARGGLAPRRVHADLAQGLGEEVAVLGGLDGADRAAEDADAVPLEDPGAVQGHSAVEGGLAPEGQEDAVGPLLLDHLLDVLGRDRQEVGGVGHALAGLDGRDVRVDEDGPDALLAEGLEGLGAGVVELAGLADLQAPGAEDDDLLDVAHRAIPETAAPLAAAGRRAPARAA
jgi:hypothetical protein